MIWHILERWPNGEEYGVDTLSAGRGVDAIPEASNNHADSNDEEREEESEGRPGLNRERNLVLRTDNTVEGEADRHEEVTKRDDDQGHFPGEA